MIQKNYKLQISDNKTIIKEVQGGSPYAQTAMKGAGQLTISAGEALKMTGAFLKRSWGATFGYMFTVYQSVRSHGVIRGLAVANKQFTSKDKQIKNEMKSLIKAQPGAKDAELFIGMTCPAARAFDVFVDKDFKQINLPGNTGKGSRERDREKYKAFYNFVMIVSHISHGTKLKDFEENNKRLTRKQREKSIKKKYKVDKEALKNLQTEKFVDVCKAITFLHKPNRNLRKIFKKNDVSYPTLNTLQNGFVKFMLSNQDKNKCLKFISEGELESTVVSLSNLLSLDDSIKCVKYILKNENLSDSADDEGEEEERLNSGFSLLLKKNKTIIKEAEEEEEEDVSSEKVKDLKSGMALSFATFYIMRSSILSILSDITVSVSIAINTATDVVFNSILSEKNDINISESKNILLENKENSAELSGKIEKVNKQIDLFNRQFEYSIEKIDIGILKDLQGFASKITKEVEKSEAELDSKLKDDKEKKVARSTGIIEILEKIKSSASEINLSSEISVSINNAKKIIEEDMMDLDEILILVGKNKNKLSDVGLSENSIAKIKNTIDKATKDINDLNDIENKITSYTDRIEQLKSSLDEDINSLDEEKSKETDTETIEIPKEKLDIEKEKWNWTSGFQRYFTKKTIKV